VEIAKSIHEGMRAAGVQEGDAEEHDLTRYRATRRSTI
jgi:hypothetical protein